MTVANLRQAEGRAGVWLMLATGPVLGFCAGFLDATSYLLLEQTFVAFITGSMVILGIDLVLGTGSPPLKLAAISAFFVSACFWILAIRAVQPARKLLSFLLLSQAALLLAFALLGVFLTSARDVLLIHQLITLTVLGAFAMGLQSVILIEVLAERATLPMVPGSTLRFLGTAAAAMGLRGNARPARGPGRFVRAAEILFSLAMFFLGVLAGAFACDVAGFGGVFVPAVLLIVFGIGFATLAEETPTGHATHR